MKKILLLLLIIAGLSANAQKYTISGTVKDNATNETLIGATVIYGDGKGMITDVYGKYSFKVNPGTYHIKVSFVGYVTEEADITVTDKSVTRDFSLKTPTLSEVEVVADVAKRRETPVAFTNVAPLKLQEELASRDIPMILNKTPGVYATQLGGGDGDARINVRGFSQRNLAVMIDGIPVNDMENGWVYWSNWFGLDAVTRNIQVQRGLGASKLALPSVGGTMNIITKGIETQKGIFLKQEVGSEGFLRTSLGLSSGPLAHDWNVTFAGSYKRGNGWVDQTWTKGWFFYLRVDKKIGNHTLTLSAMGAPQSHGQRTYKQLIRKYDTAYAEELGDSTASESGKDFNLGTKYNVNWGYLNRWNNPEEKANNSRQEELSQSMNYYFKPQFSLRDFWHVNDRFYISNILYASIGHGGGTGTASFGKYGAPGNSTFMMDSLTNQINFQYYYDRNKEDSTKLTTGIIRSSVNNHQWYGLLSTFNYEINENWTFSGGIDVRTFHAEHYMEIYDMLGAEYLYDNSNQNRYDKIKLYKGDKIRYNWDGLVRWGGVFALLEFKKDNWSAFLNLTGAVSGYKRLDYWRNKDLTIGDNKYKEIVGYGDKFFSNGTDTLLVLDKEQYYISNDTVYRIRGGQTDYITGADMYTIDSREATTTATDWNWFPGFTVKGGVNYNIDSRNNVYLNLGYLSKAPRFQNVYDNNNKEFVDPRNEIVEALELGYNLSTKNVTLNVNGYLTFWQNRPLEGSVTLPNDGNPLSANINNMNALHKGIEIEFGWKPIKSLQWDQVISLGDWRWNSADTARFYDQAGNLEKLVYFDATGVHVGDAAQFQIMEGLRWEIIKSLYVSGSVTYFGKNYAQFDPVSLPEPRESWKMPDYYLVDMNAGYRINFKEFKLDLRASVLNLLDRQYIADAQNNDSYVTSNKNFDAASASVYFGVGRTFNLSLALTY